MSRYPENRFAAIVRSPALAGQARLFFADLRWPRERPRLNAFCRNAPAVRFMLFTTALIGDLLFEWLLSSRSSSFVHGRRTARFFAFFAISLSMFAELTLQPMPVLQRNFFLA
jgi:hypothetical protein